jgi:hypothetical protein
LVWPPPPREGGSPHGPPGAVERRLPHDRTGGPRVLRVRKTRVAPRCEGAPPEGRLIPWLAAPIFTAIPAISPMRVGRARREVRGEPRRALRNPKVRS